MQGCSTSLPEDVQWRLIRSIPALRNAELMRIGYAVEYDAVPPSEITAWLESKRVAGLFLAGQINGTSGYEEAAGQGIMGGINAALYCRRDQGPGGAGVGPGTLLRRTMQLPKPSAIYRPTGR